MSEYPETLAYNLHPLPGTMSEAGALCAGQQLSSPAAGPPISTGPDQSPLIGRDAASTAAAAASSAPHFPISGDQSPRLIGGAGSRDQAQDQLLQVTRASNEG